MGFAGALLLELLLLVGTGASGTELEEDGAEYTGAAGLDEVVTGAAGVLEELLGAL